MSLGAPGSYPFHPAALAYAAVTVSWPDQIFRYPTPFSNVGLFDTSGCHPLGIVRPHPARGRRANIPSLDLVLGNYAGPMGATFCIVIAAVAVYLLLKRRISFELPRPFWSPAA